MKGEIESIRNAEFNQKWRDLGSIFSERGQRVTF